MDDASGKLLTRMIGRTEDPHTKELLKREDFSFLYLKEGCDGLDAAAVRNLLGADAIVALGDTPLQCLTSHWGIGSLRGYVFPTRFGPVVGSYAPDYIRKGKFPLARVFQMDLQRALKVARGENYALEKHYTLVPSWKEAYEFLEAFRNAGCPPLAFDIETPYARIDKDTMVGDLAQEDDASYTILRISFAFKGCHAITMPWCAPFISIARELLACPGDKIVWNRHFDVPRLSAQDMVFGGRVIDGMDAWHFLEPSLPMGLKYAATFFCPDMHAWKLESGQKPEWYSCADSDVLLRVYAGIKTRLTDAGKWNVFERHFVELAQVLGAMSRRGVLVDPALRKARYEEFLARFTQIVEDLQPLVPVDLKKKKIYKKSKEWMVERGKWIESRILPVLQVEWRRKPKPKKEKKPRAKKEQPSTSKKGPRKKSKPAEIVGEMPKQSTSS